MPQKYFDLHIEIGDVQPGIYYAKTILGNNGIKFEHQGPTPAQAMFKIISDMENAGIWPLIANNPGMTPYPFLNGTSNAGPTTTAATTTPTKKGADPVRERPADLGSTPKGQCEAICISFDNFGVTKCNNICKGKK